MDWLRVKRVTQPVTSIVSLGQAKAHLRVSHDTDDTYITALIDTATAFIEGPNGAGIAVLPAQWRITMDHLPRAFDIDLCPVQSLDSITVDGVTISSDLYTADLDSVPARVVGSYIPQVRTDVGKVKVTFTAGYNDVPADLMHCALLLIGHLYENREAASAGVAVTEVPFAVEAILSRYRAYG